MKKFLLFSFYFIIESQESSQEFRQFLSPVHSLGEVEEVLEPPIIAMAFNNRLIE